MRTPRNVKWHYYLIAHKAPFDEVPLPDAVVVASVTCDPRFMGKLDPHATMKTFADKMGLVDFEITTSEAQDLPGHQLGLPFPPHRKRGHR